MPVFTAGELAQALGAALEGDAALQLHGVADLREAGPAELSFVANPRYLRHLPASRAGAVLVAPTVQAAGRTVLRVADPYLAFARAMALFHPQPWPAGGVDPRAAVHPTAQLGPGVHLEPFAAVGAGAVLGEGCWIQSGAFVGPGARLGPRCRLMPGAVVMDGCTLGAGVWLNPGAVVGAEGFGFAPSPQGPVKIPQAGTVRVGDEVELGANTCVDRGALGETVVGDRARLDNLCQVGHGATVGPDSVLVAYAAVAGSTRLGRGVVMAVRSTALGHLQLGDRVEVAAHALVARDAEPGSRLGGAPAQDHWRWLWSQQALSELPALLDELRALRARVEALERAAAGPPEER